MRAHFIFGVAWGGEARKKRIAGRVWLVEPDVEKARE